MQRYYEKGNVQLFCGNNLEILDNLEKESVDMIFADPPYAKDELFHEVLALVADRRLLLDNGILIVEKPVSLKLNTDKTYEVLKDKTYGSTELVFLSALSES